MRAFVSEWADLNRRPHRSERCALATCATLRYGLIIPRLKQKTAPARSRLILTKKILSRSAHSLNKLAYLARFDTQRPHYHQK